MPLPVIMIKPILSLFFQFISSESESTSSIFITVYTCVHFFISLKLYIFSMKIVLEIVRFRDQGIQISGRCVKAEWLVVGTNRNLIIKQRRRTSLITRHVFDLTSKTVILTPNVKIMCIICPSIYSIDQIELTLCS